MTTLKPQAWEHTLLALAHEATSASAISPVAGVQDAGLLQRAYAQCDALTAYHSRSFYLATHFLPPDKRRAVRALYAFCRVCDNIADCAAGDRQAKLVDWRRVALTNTPPAEDLVATAWADTRLRYHVPARYAEQLIDGVACDLTCHRYPTFHDLAAYAYSVASTVGLMSMHITGYRGPEAIPYAIKLGVALQLTNILRDVGEDWRMGRCYLPLDELAAFNLTTLDVNRGQVNERWQAFMRFQIARNRQLYAEAWPGIALLHPDGRFAVAAAAALYSAILQDIEAHDYDVFNRRAHVGTLGKLRRIAQLQIENYKLQVVRSTS